MANFYQKEDPFATVGEEFRVGNFRGHNLAVLLRALDLPGEEN